MHNKEAKRDLILQAALDVFAKEGFDRATMQGIADCAGVGKGTLYDYFQSKQALFYCVIQSGVLYLMTELKVELADDKPFLIQLNNLYRRHMQIIREQAKLKEIMRNNFGKIPNDLHGWLVGRYFELITLVESRVATAVRRGEMKPVDPYVAACMLLNGLKVIYTIDVNNNEKCKMVLSEQMKMIGYWFTKQMTDAE